MRFFTCTPVAFGGAADFFARDSGLMCRGLQALGCESKAVMPGPCRDDDEADLIRTEYQNLESADWWKSHHLDGVVLYAWGRPKFRKVAGAIHEAGIFLVLNQDNGGLISPLAGFRGWMEEQRIMTSGRKEFLTSLARGLTIGLFVTDPLRAIHLKQGDLIACVSPVAAEHYRKLCQFYGGGALAKRVAVIPHPVEQAFDFPAYLPSNFTAKAAGRMPESQGPGHSARSLQTNVPPDSKTSAPHFPVMETKSRQIVCIGRWEDHFQKRPRLMQSVIQRLATKDPLIHVEIVGSLTKELEKWHDALDADLQSRVHLRGRVSRLLLLQILRSSRIFYSPSAYESFGIAAGEALCCGCSVVAGKSPSMASFEWFVSMASGQLASSSNALGHLDALFDELAKWDHGERNPHEISMNWTTRLHADHVAAQVLALRKYFSES